MSIMGSSQVHDGCTLCIRYFIYCEIAWCSIRRFIAQQATSIQRGEYWLILLGHLFTVTSHEIVHSRCGKSEVRWSGRRYASFFNDRGPCARLLGTAWGQRPPPPQDVRSLGGLQYRLQLVYVSKLLDIMSYQISQQSTSTVAFCGTFHLKHTCCQETGSTPPPLRLRCSPSACPGLPSGSLPYLKHCEVKLREFMADKPERWSIEIHSKEEIPAEFYYL